MIPTGQNGLPMVATYDNTATGERESYYDGRLTAVWHNAHLKTYPWGDFPDVPNGFARIGRRLYQTQPVTTPL
jgi:hypothetical protein